MQFTTDNLRSSVLLWEKLRLAYNGVMVALGVPIGMKIFDLIQNAPPGKLLGPKGNYDASSMVFGCIVFGVLANLCYFAGPLGDLYIQLLFKRQIPKWARYTAFAVGLCFSLTVMLASWMYIDLVVNL